jgi:3-dehydroquinate synthase
VRIPVGGPSPYEVVVGEDLLGELPGLVSGAAQVAIVHPPVMADRAARAAAILTQKVTRIEVPDGEAAKTLAVAGRCWDALGAAGFTRTDVVVGLGGGATTDLAGWVAAAWLRGVRVVQLPTTLLGMVDAAVGGKTGIDIGAGKNLVGAFHPPAGVLCDLTTLATLPPEDLRAGLAEVVKCGFIADPVILDRLDGPVGELVERAVRVKAGVVTRDLREGGEREFLNYGHTLGHAIERREHYRMRHGDAVSIGLVFAAALGHAAGRLDRRTADRHRSVLQGLGLPVTYDATAWPELHAAMRVDKKSRGATLRFVVLDALAAPGILADPTPAQLAEAWSAVAV